MKNLTTHFTNITKGSNPGRPILQGISYNKEQKYIAATDSHRMLYIHTDTPATYVQNPLTLEFLEGTYPDVTRLIPKEGQEVYFDAGHIEAGMIAILKAMKEEVIEIHVTDFTLSIHKEHQGALISFKLTNQAPQNEIIAANAKYVCQALSFVKDAYKDFTKEVITFKYTSPVRPFTFHTECYDYLITPVRRRS